MILRAVAIVVAAGLSLAACGGSDGDGAKAAGPTYSVPDLEETKVVDAAVTKALAAVQERALATR